MENKGFVVWATSAPTGLNIICRRHGDSAYVVDIYTTKMTMNPETGERFFSFAPLYALSREQMMLWEDFNNLANRGVHCGAYAPSPEVVKAYLSFVDDQEKVCMMADYYLRESGPAQEYLNRLEHEQVAKVKAEAAGEQRQAVENATVEGNVITGVFARKDEA